MRVPWRCRGEQRLAFLGGAGTGPIPSLTARLRQEVLPLVKEATGLAALGLRLSSCEFSG